MPSVSIVIQSLDRGGTETQLLSVLPGLTGAGFSMTVYTLRGRGALDPAFLEKGIAVECLFSPGRFVAGIPFLLLAPLAIFRLAARFRACRPDIVHTYLPLAGLVGGTACALARRGGLVTSRRHRNERLRSYVVRGALERIVNRQAQAVTANSLRVAQDLEGEGVARDRIALIHNGVDTARFEGLDRKKARTSRGLPGGAIVMVMVANLVVHKGHADVFAALATVRDRLKGDWRLVLVGRDDGEEARLRRMADEGGFSRHAVFAGEQEDVVPYLAAADLGLLASHEEGFSNAILECMAVGLPMIVTDVGGNAEAVAHGECGLVVKPRATEMLAEAILRLAGDARMRQRFGRAARRRVKSLFTVDRAVSKQAALYRSVLEDKPLPSRLRPPPGSCA